MMANTMSQRVFASNEISPCERTTRENTITLTTRSTATQNSLFFTLIGTSEVQMAGIEMTVMHIRDGNFAFFYEAADPVSISDFGVDLQTEAEIQDTRIGEREGIH